MPKRKTILATGEVYHVFNRSLGQAPIFTSEKTNYYFTFCLKYYRFKNTPLKLSHFLSLSKTEQKERLLLTKKEKRLNVSIYSYCLMSNHYHLLLKQQSDYGLSNFMRKTGDSFSRYFNTKTERAGPLFEGVFKAVRIENDEQMLHVNRYIHINPYVGQVVKRSDLFSYKWSSLPEYLSKKTAEFIETEAIMSNFSSKNEYKKFLLDEADYKKSQQKFKHLSLEN